MRSQVGVYIASAPTPANVDTPKSLVLSY